MCHIVRATYLLGPQLVPLDILPQSPDADSLGEKCDSNVTKIVFLAYFLSIVYTCHLE